MCYVLNFMTKFCNIHLRDDIQNNSPNFEFIRSGSNHYVNITEIRGLSSDLILFSVKGHEKCSFRFVPK